MPNLSSAVATSSFKILLVLWVTATSASSASSTSSKVELTSREYKTLLNVKLFASPNDVQRVLLELQQDVAMAAANAGATSSLGSFSLKKNPRLVRYFDTPGTCLLNKNSFTLRLRRPVVVVENDNDSAAAWEATLKTRNGDRYFSASRKKYVKGCNTAGYQKGKSKFEEDIAHFDWTGSVYSYSQKCYISEDHGMVLDGQNNETTSTLQVVGDVWGDMETYLSDELNLDLNTPLALVSNLTLTQVDYEDFWIDLEEHGGKEERAEGKVTLWYHTTRLQAYVGDPIVAELSFRIKSKHESWSDTTLMRMHNFWETCAASLKSKWLDLDSMTKTKWIYQYDPNFCHSSSIDPEEEDEEEEEST